MCLGIFCWFEAIQWCPKPLENLCVIISDHAEGSSRDKNQFYVNNQLWKEASYCSADICSWMTSLAVRASVSLLIAVRSRISCQRVLAVRARIICQGCRPMMPVAARGTITHGGSMLLAQQLSSSLKVSRSSSCQRCLLQLISWPTKVLIFTRTLWLVKWESQDY